MVVGGGPAGSTVSALLARAGVDVTLFDPGARPDLVVGESLVPAVVPILRQLGIEDEVRSYSVYKPGATFVLSQDFQISFGFDEVRGAETRYSYNTPRSLLDASILAAARRAGVRIVEKSARVERVAGTDRLELSRTNLENADLAEQPDFMIDATGRSRLFSRLLGLPARRGPRRDAALFAHMDGVPLVSEGHVHTDVLDRGWAWRIPLPNRVSVGLVVPTAYADQFGRAAEQQFDGILQADSAVKRWGGAPRRTSSVLRYNNYQLISERGVGPGWALVGDAFGFVDPVFSSGLLVGLDAAVELARSLTSDRSDALQRYESHVQGHLQNWQRVVEHFYNGRLMTLFRVGEYVRGTLLGRVMDPHFRKHLPRVFTGEATTKRYGVGLTDFMCRYGIAGNDPTELSVR